MNKLTDENRVWHVTTEGDCEGRTIKDFGYFKGNLIDIAKKLSGLAYYQLSFREFKLSQIPTNTNIRKEVHLSVDFMEGPALAGQLAKEGVAVSKSNYYKAIKINIAEDEINNLKREAALAKLSQEERELLGLK